MNIKDMTLCAFFTILFTIASKLMLPIGVIPVTLQTAVVIMAGLLLTPKQITYAYGLYFIMGLIGLPVFANGGGIAYVLQPSFGFLLSFPLAACFISTCKQRFSLTGVIASLPLCFSSFIIIYTIGCAYMYAIFHFYIGSTKDIYTILMLGVIPFLVSDGISATLGCICALRLQKVPIIERSLRKL